MDDDRKDVDDVNELSSSPQSTDVVTVEPKAPVETEVLLR